MEWRKTLIPEQIHSAILTITIIAMAFMLSACEEGPAEIFGEKAGQAVEDTTENFQQIKENVISNLIVIGFSDEAIAFAERAELVKIQKEYLIEMEDVVVVTKDEKDGVKLHQALNLTPSGAVGGSFWGLLIGFLFSKPCCWCRCRCWSGSTQE